MLQIGDEARRSSDPLPSNSSANWIGDIPSPSAYVALSLPPLPQVSSPVTPTDFPINPSLACNANQQHAYALENPPIGQLLSTRTPESALPIAHSLNPPPTNALAFSNLQGLSALSALSIRGSSASSPCNSNSTSFVNTSPPLSYPLSPYSLGGLPLVNSSPASEITPVMHPNLVTTLKNLINDPNQSSSTTPSVAHSKSSTTDDQDVSLEPSPCGSPRSSYRPIPRTWLGQVAVPRRQATASHRPARGVKRRGQSQMAMDERKSARPGGVGMSANLPPTSQSVASSGIRSGGGAFSFFNRSVAMGEAGPSRVHPSPVHSDCPILKVGRRSDGGSQDPTVVPLELINNKRPFTCPLEDCGKTFKNWQTMRMHMKTHDDLLPLPAGGMGGGANAAGMQPWHGNGRAGANKKIPSKCFQCGENFVGLYELRRHYGRKHQQGEKPFGCNKCDKRFFIEVDLRDHAKVCGEQILCTCGSTFAFKCNLINHQKSKPECRAAAALAAQQGRGGWGTGRGGAGGTGGATDGPKGQKKKAGVNRRKVAAAPALWNDTPTLGDTMPRQHPFPLSQYLPEVRGMQGRATAQGSATAADMTAVTLAFANSSGHRVPLGVIPACGATGGGMSVATAIPHGGANLHPSTVRGNRQGGVSDGVARMVRVEVLPAPAPLTSTPAYGSGGWKGGQESKMRQCVPWARRGSLE